ncbi:MAG: hypothetical protein EZS28_031144, partial [Streblomastix strix]
MKLWVACIQADAALMKNERLQNVNRASQGKTRTFRDIDTDLLVPSGGLQMHPVKRKQEQDGIQEIRVLNPLQAQFQAQRQIYSKFNSTQDQVIAQDLTSTFEELLKQESIKLDVLNYQLQPIPRQKLFDEISWKGANTIFPMPEAPPALPQEGPAYARMTLESTSAVTQGIAGTILEIAQGNTENLVGKMFKLLEASLVAVGDAQQERESRLRGVSQGITTEDVLSKHSKEKFKKSGKHIQISQRRFGNQVEQSSGFRRGRIHLNKRQFQYRPRGAFKKDECYSTSLYKSRCQFISSQSQPVITVQGSLINKNESLAFDPANEGDGAVRRESLAFDPANEEDGAVRRESLAFDPANE